MGLFAKIIKLISIVVPEFYWPQARAKRLRLHFIFRFKWDNIQTTELISVAGLRFLRVTLQKRTFPLPLKKFYFPLYYSGSEMFVKDVFIHSPPDSQFRVELSKNYTDLKPEYPTWFITNCFVAAASLIVIVIMIFICTRQTGGLHLVAPQFAVLHMPASLL